MFFTILFSLFTPIFGAVEAPEAEDAFRAAIVAAIHQFAKEGEVDHLKAIVDKYPQPHKPLSTDSFGPIHQAAWHGQVQVVAYLLKKNVDPNVKVGFGESPLHIAAGNGHLPIVKLLLENGADLDTRTDVGLTALHRAAMTGHLPVVKLLVKSGINLKVKTIAIPESNAMLPSSPDDGKPTHIPATPARTALELAEEFKRVEVIEFLKMAENEPIDKASGPIK